MDHFRQNDDGWKAHTTGVHHWVIDQEGNYVLEAVREDDEQRMLSPEGQREAVQLAAQSQRMRNILCTFVRGWEQGDDEHYEAYNEAKCLLEELYPTEQKPFSFTGREHPTYLINGWLREKAGGTTIDEYAAWVNKNLAMEAGSSS